MEQSNGFSMTELLISLSILTCTLLVLLKHQYRCVHQFQLLELKMQAAHELNNRSEDFFSRLTREKNIIKNDIQTHDGWVTVCSNQQKLKKRLNHAHRKLYL